MEVQSFTRRAALVLSAMAFVLPAASGMAQDQPDASAGKKILERYVQATGGREKYNALKSAIYEGDLKIPEANIEGKMSIRFRKPDMLLFSVDLGALGVQKRGINGTVAWDSLTITGARLMEGEEAERMLESPSMKTVLEPDKVFTSIKDLGIENVDGEECNKVELTRKSGDVDVTFYSKKTGLEVKSIVTVPTPMGKLPIETFTADYRDVEGLKMAFKNEQKLPNGISQVMQFTSIKFNVDIPDGVFALPEDVRALLKKDEK